MAESIGAKARFETLDGDRQSTVDRAILCSELTIPHLMRDDSASEQDDLSREYVQGFGAKLVNHLVGKFALAVLPPSQPFYRLSATDEAMEAVAGDNTAAQHEIEKQLAKKEDGILRYINKSRFRTALYPALKLAIVTGSSLIEKTEDNTYRVFNLKSFVIVRDFKGKVIELIIREVLTQETLPEEVTPTDLEEGDDSEIELYTVVQLIDKKYQLHQEIDDVVVGSEETFEMLSDKFIDVRWTKINDENYGRSFVEEYLGTLLSLNKQLKVLNESGAIAAKTIFTLNPNGLTKYKDLVNAKNGDVIIGKDTDVTTIKVDKNSDMAVMLQLSQENKKELAEAFLMGSAAIRDAERVTKAEVQMVATELEQAFGGVYTAIAEDIQMPLIESAIKNLKFDGSNGSDDFDVIITAGVEALGRNIELQKINAMIQEFQLVGTLVGEEAVAAAINTSNLLNAIVANSGVAGKDFLLTSGEKSSNIANQKQEEIAKTAVLSGTDQAIKSAQ